MRKLVTVQKILSIEPIEGADNIEKIKVLGWQLVATKGEFKVNDLCCYFELDSLLPIRPEFEFLRKGYYKKMADGKEGFVLKTAKFRGVISQGLALPTSILNNMDIGQLSEASIEEITKLILLNNGNIIKLEEGLEITNLLGVVKYEPPIPACLGGTVKGYLPGSLVTDETRVQTLQPFLDKYQGELFYITEKIDGASTTYYIDEENNFHACSRNLSYELDTNNSIWKYALAHNIEAKLRSLPFRAAIQGEINGEGIQGNKYKQIGQSVRFFTIRNLGTKEFLSYVDFVHTISHLELIHVPILDESYRLPNNIEELVEKSIGKSILNNNIEREGIVLRLLNEKFDANFDLSHSRVSFKVINPKFLLKYED